MEFVLKHALGVFEVDGASASLIILMSGLAAFAARRQLAGPVRALLAFPLMVLISLLALYVCQVSGLYDPKKIAEWLTWTVVSGTIGTTLAVGLIAATAQFGDRDVPEPSDRRRKGAN